MKIKEKFNRFRARRNLINKYKYLIEIDKLLEEHEFNKILNGNLNDKQMIKSREQLVEIKLRLASQQEFVAFLKSI